MPILLPTEISSSDLRAPAAIVVSMDRLAEDFGLPRRGSYSAGSLMKHGSPDAAKREQLKSSDAVVPDELHLIASKRSLGAKIFYSSAIRI